MRCSSTRWASAALLAVALQARAHEGWGVTVHERHGVVISDIPGNTIWRIRDGRAEALARGIHSHALIAGGDGAIYGSNPDPRGTASSVWRIDADGRLAHVVPPANDSPLGLQSFLITEGGTIYSANRYDHRNPKVELLRRSPDGSIAVVATGFTAIDGLREEPDGSILIVDGAKLRRVSPGGRVSDVTSALTESRFGEDLLGLSSIRDGAVHVADLAGRRVLRVTLNSGASVTVDRSGFFWAPAGVELADGALYILEHLRPPLALLGDLQLGPYLRVRRVAADGTSETLAVVWGRRSAIAALVVGAVVAGAVWILRNLRRAAYRG